MERPTEHIPVARAELDQLRSASHSAIGHLGKIAEVVPDTINYNGSRELGPDGIREVRIRPHNDKLYFYDSNDKLVGVYEDPPGICYSA